MPDPQELSLIRAQAYLDAKQSMTTRTGKNKKGKLNCSAGNKQCGGRCIPQEWDCRLEGKGTNSELKAHQFDPLGGVSSVQRGVETIAKNPGDPKSWDRGRNSIIRGIVKGIPGDNLEEKKKIKRRLQKYGNQIGAAVMSAIAIGSTHVFLKKVNPAYRRGFGNDIDRAAFTAINAVLDRTPIIGANRAADRATIAMQGRALGRVVTGGMARQPFVDAGAQKSPSRMSVVARIGGLADFRNTNTLPGIEALNKEARAGKLSYDEWAAKATDLVYSAKTKDGHSVFSPDAANRLLTRQFRLDDLPEGVIQRSGSKREVSQAGADNIVIDRVAGRLEAFKSAMLTDMQLQRLPRDKKGNYAPATINAYIEGTALPRMNLLQPGMTAAQQNNVRVQAKNLAKQILNSENTGPTSLQNVAKNMHSKLVASYDTYFTEVSSNIRSQRDPRKSTYLFGDGQTGLARVLTTQRPISGEVRAPRIVSREHGRLILRDYFQRRVLEGNDTFTAPDATVQRVARSLMVTSGEGTIDRATAYQVVQQSGIRSLAGPPEVKPFGSTTRARSKTAQPKRKSLGQRQTDLAKSIMKREGFTGSFADALRKARQEIEGRKDRMDDEHMAPTITKRNPPAPLVTNSAPTVVSAGQGEEHLPSSDDEMVTPLVPVSPMKQAPTPKEAEQPKQEPQQGTVKISLNLELPAAALQLKRSDAYEAEKARLDTKKGKGKACGESYIPNKHECTIGATGAKLTTEERKKLTESSKQHYAEQKEKRTSAGAVKERQHTNPDGSRTAGYRARQLSSLLIRAGFTAATGYGAYKASVGEKDPFKQKPLAAAGMALMSVMGAASIKREMAVTKSTKDLVNDFSKLKGQKGVIPENVDQMTKFVQEAGIDVQRVPTPANLVGVNGFFDTAKPSRVHTSDGSSELKQSKTGRQRKMVTRGSDAEVVTASVNKMIETRAQLYANQQTRSKLIKGQAANMEDVYELHSQGQYIGKSGARALYTNSHEIAHAIHYRGDFATPKSVTVNGKTYSGAELEAELIKSTSYYGQADLRRKVGKVDDYYDTGSRLETYAENYALYINGGEAYRKNFPVSYEWTKQTTDYALSKPAKKPARTFESQLEDFMNEQPRKYIGDRMDAPMFSGAEKPKTQRTSDEIKKEREAQAKAKQNEEPKLKGDELFMDLYPKVSEAATAGNTKQLAELLSQAVEADLPADQMEMLGSYAETARMYEVIDGRAKPENESSQKFNEREADEEEEKLNNEQKTDAYWEAYNKQWTLLSATT